MLERTPVDLLLLDLYLPDGHGLGLLRSLRAAGHGADVIAVTSARDLAVVREGVSLGVVQYVLKPFTFPTLRDRLTRYAEFRRRRGRGQRAGRGGPGAGRAAGHPARLLCPRGSARPTLEAVTRVLRESAEGLTAAAAGGGGSGSRGSPPAAIWSTWWTVGSAARRPHYGQVGRPELHYRWLAGGR